MTEHGPVWGAEVDLLWVFWRQDRYGQWYKFISAREDRGEWLSCVRPNFLSKLTDQPCWGAVARIVGRLEFVLVTGEDLEYTFRRRRWLE